MLAERLAPASAVKTSGLSLKRADGYRPKLLLAEDSDPVRVVTAAMLKGMGCDVDAVVHGEEAVKSAAASRFDVIVLDIEMPIMDGITAARSIRQMGGATRQTPIMALSAFLADAMRSSSWRDTFDIALPKPANRAELHAAVKTALAYPARLAKPSFDAEPLISGEQRAQLKSGLSEEVWQALLRVACRDIETCLAQLSSTEGRGQVIVLAQKLKGLGRTFAAPRLAAIASWLERSGPESDVAELISLLAETGAATIAALNGK